MRFIKPLRAFLAAISMLTSLASALPDSTANAQSGTGISFGGWTFDYQVSGNYDGLSLLNVKYQGKTIAGKISLPVMRVFYQNNACGPYADRLGGTLSTIPWANNATVAQRTFTLDGSQWYEIGIRDKIGQYDIYQAYYFRADGTLDAHIYSKGLQCQVFHTHYPNWRIDFDLDGDNTDQIQRNTASGFTTYSNEFNASATAATNHGWRVRDTVTGLSVDVLPGFTNFTIPNANNTPVTGYSNNTVFGRLYRASEDTGWTFGPNTQVPNGNGEAIGNNDIVFWYEGYLPHSPSEGSNLWHSTGVRMVVNIGAASPTPTPIAPTATLQPTNTSVPSPTNTPVPSPTNTPVAPTATPNSGATIVDPLNDFSRIVAASSSPGFTFDNAYAEYFGSDASRLMRTGPGQAWATWQQNGMSQFVATTFFWTGEAVNHFTFFASGDNVNFSSVTPSIANLGGEWIKVIYTLSLPAGTNFVRVVFANNTISWTPQISEVRYSSGSSPAPTNTPAPLPTNTPAPQPTATPSAQTLLSANFDAGTNGFTYADNLFRSSTNGNYASGARITTGSYSGGGLQVSLGGVDNNTINGISGGWVATINAPTTGNVTVTFRHRLTQSSEYESDEYSETLVSIDGQLRGLNGADYIARIAGNGNGGSEISTGWQQVTVSLGSLSAGSHTLHIGGYNNKKTYNNETTTLVIDDVIVTRN